jgi:predicted DsbA family dithiol-disulfide isomerase
MSERIAKLSVDVYSDVVCPWCYIGKRRLERALGSIDDRVRVIWRPFQLNPTMPPSGIDRKTYLEAKFGSMEAFGRLEKQILAAGEGEGIPFALEKIQRTPNTFAAHRLIWHAEGLGKQDAMVEALFRAYFLEGQDIGNVKSLVHVAAEAGLDRADSEAYLSSEEGVTEVKVEEAAGYRLGIRGVPYFVFNGTYAISGAQPPERIVAALKAVGADAVVRKVGG